VAGGIVGQSLTNQGITIYWRAVGGQNNEAGIMAVAVARAESNGNTAAVSPAGAVGLWQIMPKERGFPERPTASELTDPTVNAKQAFLISNGGTNWRAWDVAWDPPERARSSSSTYLGPNAPFRAFLDEVMQDNGGAGATAEQARTWPDSDAFGRAGEFLPGHVAGEILGSVTEGTGLASIGDALRSLPGALRSLLDAVTAAGRWLSNRQNWFRIAQVVIGGALLLVAIANIAPPGVTVAATSARRG
jgi:hypothetical protein